MDWKIIETDRGASVNLSRGKVITVFFNLLVDFVLTPRIPGIITFSGDFHHTLIEVCRLIDSYLVMTLRECVLTTS